MFSLHEHPATMSHMSPYSEQRGDETVHCLALKFETSLPSADLACLDKELPKYLFSNGVPRFPKAKPLQWEDEVVGGMVTIDPVDLFEEKALRFEATVDKFVIEPIAGNAASITLRVKIKPNPEDVAVLYQLQGHDVQLTIEPPKAGAAPKSKTPDLADQAQS